MLNEGVIQTSSRDALKSEMVNQIAVFKELDANQWQARVFQVITGESAENIDFDDADNVCNYRIWVRNFDQYIQELVEDGYVEAIGKSEDGYPIMKAINREASPQWSHSPPR